MTGKTATLSMRVQPDIKQTAEEIFNSLGLTLTEAVNVFLYRSIAEGGFPFEVKQPRFNKEMEEADEEARAITSGEIESKGYTSTEELFSDLMAEVDQ